MRSPCRYAGGEVGSFQKSWEGADVRLCLAFPDVYEIGMSHLGLAILHHIVNREPRMLAERAFAPWADMEAELRRRGQPLFSLESHRPLADFDIIGFSLGYELTFTNVLAMLGLCGISLRAADRLKVDGFPLVIAGGPCAFNPMPVAPFFDAIVVGDGEQAILDIANAVAEWKHSGAPRISVLHHLAQMRGIFVPLVHGREPATPVGCARVADLDAAPFPASPIVPHMATQERVAVEVSRGCARGCRFCQAGMIYRPVRQRSGEAAAGLAAAALASGGGEEFSFLSLSIGDWAPLEGALAEVHARAGAMPVNATLPSLRAEALTQPVIDCLGGARAGSFTLAPEAGSERMRRFINKGNTDGDLFASVEKVFASGWHAIKLYFLVGLPDESDADIDGICTIANRCLDIGRRHHRRPEVTVSTSTFVPKAHTPLQWERQISIAEAEELQRHLKKRLRRPGLFYRWHDAGMSFLEGVFSRGGTELADVIERAFRAGARFDGWDECFDLSIWRDAFAAAGIEPEAFLGERGCDAVFPWEALGAGPDRAFLWREHERAHELMATPDCTAAECQRCGMCDFREVKKRIAARPETRDPRHETQGASEKSRVSRLESRVCRYRLRYTKRGCAAFLGSIETLDALRRGLRAAKLSLVYSEGFHPRPRVSAGPALPVGIESDAEFADVEMMADLPPQEILRRLQGRLPEGMEAVEAERLVPPYRSIEASIASTDYQVCLEGRGVIGVSVTHEKSAPKLKEILAGEHGVDGDAMKSVRIRKVGITCRTS